MTIEVTISIKRDNGEPKTYKLDMTAEATKNTKTGKTSLAHFQPAAENPVVKGFSKLYIDTEALSKEAKAKK